MKKAVIIFLTFLLVSPALKSQKHDFGNNHQPVRSVFFSPDNQYLIAGGFLKIYNLENNSEVYNTTSLGDINTANLILHADMSTDGKYLVMLKTGRLEIFDLQTRSQVTRVGALNMAAAAIAPDNKTLVYARGNGQLVFYNIPSQSVVSKHDLGRLKPNRLAWSDSGEFIAIGSRSNALLLYDVSNKEIKFTARLQGRFVWDLEFSYDSKYLGVALKSGHVILIDTDNGEALKSWKAHDGNVYALTFHPSGNYMATGGADNQIRIWQIPSGNAVKSWQAHDKSVLALDFSPDGTMLASGCMNGPLIGVNDTKVWDARTAGINIRYAESQTDNLEEQDVSGEEVKPVREDLQASTTAKQKRLALIIGNGIYQNGGILANPENDANDIGERLQNLGFDVMLYNNLGQADFKEAIDEFGVRLNEYDVGLFYYAGHGIQVKGNNYLIPVDANLRTENDVEYDCVNAGRLLAKMEDAGSTTNIVILDACRDNPFERSWRRATHGMGLAFMTAPAGSLISYATSPGSTASDGSGRNGLFTSALLQYIDEPGISILEMFQKVRTYVRENSDGQQVPWESTSLEGNFYFK